MSHDFAKNLPPNKVIPKDNNEQEREPQGISRDM